MQIFVPTLNTLKMDSTKVNKTELLFNESMNWAHLRYGMQMNFICSSEKPLLHNTINCKLFDEKSWTASAVISHLPLKYKRCKWEHTRLVHEMKQIFQKLFFISSLDEFWWVYIKPQEHDFLCLWVLALTVFQELVQMHYWVQRALLY